jgi:protocatechuate 3,4-dioxygenase, alpha subunit
MTLPTTPSQTVGPFYSIGICRRSENEPTPGGVRLSGHLLDGEGVPIPDGVIEIWSATARTWGRCGTDVDGRFTFSVAKPPAARGEAPRLDVLVFARGLLRHQLTRVYFPEEERANAADPVLSSLDPADRDTLVATTDGDGLRFDIRMQGDSQTVFFA